MKCILGGDIMGKTAAKGTASATTTTNTTAGWTKTVPAISADTAKNQEVDGVLSGVKWNTDGSDWRTLSGSPNGSISFSFPDLWTDYGKNYGSNEHRKNFGSFSQSPDQQLAFYDVLAGMGTVVTSKANAKDIQYISAVTPLTFTEFTGTSDKDAVLRFGKTDMKSAEAWSYYPSSTSTGGDAWFSNQYINFNNLKIGTYDYTVLMHELGHSLGLKHSFEKTSYGVVPVDSLSYTVMSYASYPGADNWYGGTAYDFPQTLMMYDIAALQQMYGANWGANAGATTYTWTPNNNKLTIQDGTAALRTFDPEGTKVYQTLWDGNGVDTYNLSAFVSNLTVDLRPGQWVNFNNAQVADIDGTKGSLLAPGNVANALLFQGNVQSLIENAIGGDGADTFVANGAANRFTGDGTADAFFERDTFVWKELGDLLNTSAPADWDTITDFGANDTINLVAIGDAIDEGLSVFDVQTGELKLYDGDATTKMQVASIFVTTTRAYADDWFAVT